MGQKLRSFYLYETNGLSSDCSLKRDCYLTKVPPTVWLNQEKKDF